jgi:UDP-N-acetyl-2-amino-2-deoxyglucuronate dehydrogenase
MVSVPSSIREYACIAKASYVAPRHLKALRDIGNQLPAAVDSKNSVGALDQYSAICSSYHLHDSHCRLAMHVGALVICEKPVVINPWKLDALQEIESETNCKVNTLPQLRVHSGSRKLKAPLDQEMSHGQDDVVLSDITSLGNSYHISWKAQIEKSGGVTMNELTHRIRNSEISVLDTVASPFLRY